MGSSRSAVASFLAVVVVWAFALPVAAQDPEVLPFEITRAQASVARLEVLTQRVSKQNLLYQLHLGDVRKSKLLATAAQIDHILESLEDGSPADSIPAPWTTTLRDRVAAVDRAWGPLRAMAIASPPDYIRLSHEATVKGGSTANDPLAVRYVDDLASAMGEAILKLMAAYDVACRATGEPICALSTTGGTQATLIEKATKEAIFVFAGIEAKTNRERLAETEAAYEKGRKANDASPVVKAAIAPERGQSGKIAGEMLAAIRKDWDALRKDFATIRAGDTDRLDVRKMLRIQLQLVARVERLTLALSRFAAARLANET